MYLRILVTGGAGFIGSNFIRYLMERYPKYDIVNLDALTYAGNHSNLHDVSGHPHYEFIRGNILDERLVAELTDGIDVVVNFAAETHVDRSIEDPGIFVRTNVLGTQALLAASRKNGVKRYIQVSTDEVYGTLGPTGLFVEDSPLRPNSPYSASKAGADLMVRAYFETFGFPGIITRCSNNYGPYQYPEKLIPLFISRALRDEAVPVYGDGKNVRDWLHVWDHCAAIDLVLHEGQLGSTYNIGGNNEKTNLDVTKTILQQLGKPESLIMHVSDRLGHDRRYAINSQRLQKQLGWIPQYTFDNGIAQTIDWYLDHREWLVNAPSTPFATSDVSS